MTLSRARFVVALLGLAIAGAGCPAERESDPDVAQLDEEAAGQLEQLGYLDWGAPDSPAALARSGVTQHDPERAWPGVNLFTSVPSHEAHLVDMSGRTLHTWRDPKLGEKPWHHVEVTPAGELFGLAGGPLRKLDWDSKLLWEAPIHAHHDLEIDALGRIHVLGKVITRLGRRRVPIVDNEIVVLAPDGKVRERHRFTDLFAGYPSPDQLAVIEARVERIDPEERTEARLLNAAPPIDAFHANSIQLIDRDIAGFAAVGDVLVSVRQLNRVFVLDLAAGERRWSWGGGQLDRPHHAVLLPDDTLSVFDNGWRREWSRVLRLDPRERRVKWRYPQRADPGFFSKRRGSAQHLPNGNVLITESDKGRVFEIEPDGAVVWEFLNPQIDASEGRRAQIYRMERLDPQTIGPLTNR